MDGLECNVMKCLCNATFSVKSFLHMHGNARVLMCFRVHVRLCCSAVICVVAPLTRAAHVSTCYAEGIKSDYRR